jgi:hypothetical protein
VWLVRYRLEKRTRAGRSKEMGKLEKRKPTGPEWENDLENKTGGKNADVYLAKLIDTQPDDS